MKIMRIRHLWGVTDPWETCIPRFREKGYEGIEAVLPPSGDERRFAELLADNGMAFIAQLLLPGRDEAKRVEDQLDALRRLLDKAMPFKPMFVNCHGGYDGWTKDQAVAFYGRALELESDYGIDIAHETHRGRYFFSPWNTRDVLNELPALKLCVDYSHWVCVCERIIDDLIDIIELSADHARHLHARVGYGEGPQVPDPRVKAYAEALAAHQRWWRIVLASRKRRGFDCATVTPEFGPPPYLQCDPATGRPLADLEAVCDWVADRVTPDP